MDTIVDWSKSKGFMKESVTFAKKLMGKYIDMELVLVARE